MFIITERKRERIFYYTKIKTKRERDTYDLLLLREKEYFITQG